ncbi:MFS transporter [Paenibacillus sp. J2TS4]|uniref:MFS transporter n=1 Tax=Paenibacillus sp. J2TS4 TaxID=2807194 RepID=UPI001B0AD69E|nr:MFS transporter [Paenibacillus sp. J2TS4]GIP34012.1 MFS transporter [Paenibacillus sp. J2TS4]
MTSKTRSSQIPVLILLCTVQFMSLLDTSIVQVALPSIQQSFALPNQQLQWVVTAYAVMCGGFLLLGGRLGDLWGRRRMLMCGMVVFTIASALAGLAPGGMILILARALQGVGAAIMLPSVLSLISLIFAEGHERNRALGLLGTISAVGFTSGLILGGLLTATLGWRFIFYVNIPIGLIILVLSPKLLPESTKVKQPLDVLGAITVTGAFVAFLYALTIAGSQGWHSLLTTGLILLSILLFLFFLIIERHTKYPLMSFSIFSQGSFIGAITASLLFGAIMGSSVYLINLYLQNILGYRPLMAAFSFLPQELLTMVAAGFVSRLVSKSGVQLILSAGMISFGLGLWLLTFITPTMGYLYAVLPGTLFIGLGAALVLVSGSIAATAGIHPEQQGLASGLWNTGPQIGTALGIAIVSAVTNLDTNPVQVQVQGSSVSMAESALGVSGFQSAFATAMIFAGIGLCSALLCNRKNKDQSDTARSRPSGHPTKKRSM